LAAELTHCGDQVQERIAQQRAFRRARRVLHPRASRPRPQPSPGVLAAPSLASWVQNVLIRVEWRRRCCPLDAISLELVTFDTQLFHTSGCAGAGYQQGTPACYEIREYLLEKLGRRCAYCKRTEVPLEIEQMTPDCCHSWDAFWTLTLACRPCTPRKGHRTAAEFRYSEMAVAGKRPVWDPAAGNDTGWALPHRLQALGLPIEQGSADGPSGIGQRVTTPRVRGSTLPVYGRARWRP
jgi:hypothetical protein